MARIDTLIGFHAVASRLRHHAATIQEIYVDRTRQDARLKDLLAAANERGVRVHAVEPDRLGGLAGGGRHQGVVARAAPTCCCWCWTACRTPTTWAPACGWPTPWACMPWWRHATVPWR